MNYCISVTQRGQRCKRHPLSGDQYCYQHVPQRPRFRLQLRPQYTLAGWTQALLDGHIDQIKDHLSHFNGNEPIWIPQIHNRISPLLLLESYGHYEALLYLVTQEHIDLTVHTHNGLDLLSLMFLPYSKRCPWPLREAIIKQILSRYDFTRGNIYFPSPDDPYITKCYLLLINHPQVNQIRPSIGSHLSWLLDQDRNQDRSISEIIVSLIRTLLSRNDYDTALIPFPHVRIQPYLVFHKIKRKIMSKRHKRSLPVPKTRTLWQRIAHNLQHPPLGGKDLYLLQGYGHLIGCDPKLRPIQICVALAQHYETYCTTLTYGHNLETVNETDLYGAPLKELPLEHIIKDDANYGFNIGEVSQIRKLKRHPYLGLEWSKVTVNGKPFFEHMIDPIHLMHQMAESFEAIDADDQQIHRLMSVYSFLTFPICQIYVDNQQCRTVLLRHLHLLTLNDPTFEDFCDILVREIGVNRQQVYSEFELCQIYI